MRKLLCFILLVAASAFAAEPPNVVVIIADDMGLGEVQALNPERCIVPTPHLDRLVAEGLSFDNGHSGASVCTPSRYALMTGRYAWRSTRTRGVGRGANGCMLDADQLTLGSFLAEQGYQTHFIGKWHQGFSSAGRKKGPKVKAASLLGEDTHAKLLPAIGDKYKDTPFAYGFDYFYGYDNSGCLNWHVENETVVKHCPSSLVIDTLAKRAVKSIKELSHAAAQKPFFLYVAFNAPHLPVAPSADWQGKSALGPYGDFVMETDAAVGEVVDALRDAGQLENTLVIFSTDNGFAVAGERENQKMSGDKTTFHEMGHYPSAAWRGNKADLYEGGHRVPFIVRWPAGGVQAGTHSDALVCQTDLMATFAELLGTDYPDTAGEDSTSFLAAMRGAPMARDQIVHHSYNGRFSIRQGDWKLLFTPASGGFSQKSDADYLAQGLPSVQLYNLANDPAEENNVQAQYPEVVGELTRLMEDFIEKGRSTPGVPQSNDRPIDYRIQPEESVYKAK